MFKDMIQKFCGQANVVPIPIPLLDFLHGNYLAAALMVQIAYWSGIKQRTTGNSWFYKTDEEWYEELRIKPKTMQRLRQELAGLGYIHVQRKRLRNGITTYHYKIAPEFIIAFEQHLSLNWTDCPVEEQPTGQIDQSSTGQIVQSIYTEITDRDFREDLKEKEDTIFSLDKPFKDSIQTAPSGVDLATPEEQVKTSSASQGNREGDINIDNHGSNDNNILSGIQKRSGNGSVGAGAAAADTAAAVAWIAALNDRTGSSYPPAAGFINQYNKVKKSNNLTDDQLLAVIDNAIASGLAGTWLSPTHLLKNALNFAFAAKAKPKSSISGKITDTDYSRLKCMQGHVYLENPADNPHVVKIAIADGYASGAIVDGQTVWHLNGTETQIYREYHIWRELNPNVKRIPSEWMTCSQPWHYLDNPKDTPYARQIDTELGFKTGAIIDGQTVWDAYGSQTRIMR